MTVACDDVSVKGGFVTAILIVDVAVLMAVLVAIIVIGAVGSEVVATARLLSWSALLLVIFLTISAEALGSEKSRLIIKFRLQTMSGTRAMRTIKPAKLIPFWVFFCAFAMIIQVYAFLLMLASPRF